MTLLTLRSELGPTEFWPGSHTRKGQQNCVEDTGSVAPLTPAGSAVLFDYRIVHRGLANVSMQVNDTCCSVVKF
eukprot:scaffold546779_cov37-Prasinocladus_malaysianus.AAC.1